jgi:hypothetical protein
LDAAFHLKTYGLTGTLSDSPSDAREKWEKITIPMLQLLNH